jgi:hypothetical protein
MNAAQRQKGLKMETCNFELETKRARRMTTEALRWSINDAREAADAAEEMARAGYQSNVGKYLDQIHVYAGELNRRKKSDNI